MDELQARRDAMEKDGMQSEGHQCAGVSVGIGNVLHTFMRDFYGQDVWLNGELKAKQDTCGVYFSCWRQKATVINGATRCSGCVALGNYIRKKRCEWLLDHRRLKYNHLPTIPRKLIHEIQLENRQLQQQVKKLLKKVRFQKKKIRELKKSLKEVKKHFSKDKVNEQLKSLITEDIALDVDDELYLVKLLTLVLLKNKQWKDSFNYQLIQQQLLCLLPSEGEELAAGRKKWNPAIIHWALSLQYRGGQGVIDILRGKAYQGQGEENSVKGRAGKLWVHPRNWGLFIPANSTLRKYIPSIDPYKLITESKCKTLADILQQKGNYNDGGLVFDEIEIRSGLVYLRSSGRLIGLTTGVIKEKNVLDLPDATIENHLAKKVLQVFYVSTDARVSFPLAYFPTTGLSGEEAFTCIKNCVDQLKKVNVQISWSSSDGFSGSVSFVKKMKEQYPLHRHFFDFVHLLKELINYAREHPFRNTDCQQEIFSIRTVFQEWEKLESPLRRIITIEDLAPFDKMKLDHATALVACAPVLKSSDHKTVRAIGDFLQYCGDLYNAFYDNKTPLAERLKKMDIARTYFQNWTKTFPKDSISAEALSFINTTVESLHSMKAHYFSLFLKELTVTSIFGTNIVENFFGKIRSKMRYLSFWQYAVVENRAWMELVKHFAVDRPFPLKNVNIHGTRCYNNQQGLSFHMTNIDLTINKEVPVQETKYQGTEMHKQRCQELALKFKTTRKRLLIREATCKDNPALSKLKDYVHCPATDCVRTFCYKKAFHNHLLTQHNYAPKLADETLEAALRGATLNEILEEEEELRLQNLLSIVTDELHSITATELQMELEDELSSICSAADCAIILFDLETTGNATGPCPQEIIQIGCWEMLHNSIFESLVKPSQSINFQYGTMVHRFRDNHLKHAQSFSLVAEKLMEWVNQWKYKKNIYWISHGHTDELWLNNEFKRAGLTMPENWIFKDSCELARALLKTPNIGVESLAKRYNVTLRDAHRALPDVHSTWILFKKIVEDLQLDQHPFSVWVNWVVLQQLPLVPNTLASTQSFQQATSRKKQSQSVPTQATPTPAASRKRQMASAPQSTPQAKRPKDAPGVYLCGLCGKVKKGHKCEMLKIH